MIVEPPASAGGHQGLQGRLLTKLDLVLIPFGSHTLWVLRVVYVQGSWRVVRGESNIARSMGERKFIPEYPQVLQGLFSWQSYM